MKMTAAQEREKQTKLKALRKELDQEIQEQLEEKNALEDLTGAQKFQIESLREEDLQDPKKAKQVVEALIFASSKPLTPAEIRKVTKVLTVSQIEKIVAELKADYQTSERCFELLEIAGGYELSTKREFAPWILKIELQRKARQATQSALETLAILAYKQPLTRAEIEGLRGVDTSGVLSTLMEKNFIKIVGKKEVPGRPFMYGTTEKFLEHFGLKALQDLPSIEEIRQIVDSSVKKDELIGTRKIVDVPQEGTTQDGTTPVSGMPADVPLTEGEATPSESEETIQHGPEPTTQEN